MNDLQLWQDLIDGKKAALEKIYQEQVRALLKYGNKFSRDSQLIEDSVQDLFVELWRKRANLGPTDNIRRYLLVALRRKIIRQIERSRKRFSEGEPTENHFGAEMSIDEEIIGAEVSAAQSVQLKRAFETLSKRQQEALYLKYYADLDYKDIGEVMDINYQSVRNLVFKALQTLRKSMVLLWWVLHLLASNYPGAGFG